MAEEIPQSHIRLATTATAGAGGEHSPYYRRMLSAGYKGFIQGTIGGATLYGIFGGAVGLAVSLGLMLVPGVGLLGLAAVPICAGAGVMKGASTFGQIGSTAAIYAEGAELNERRRALLDRLTETNSQKEADEILNLLHQENKEKPPAKMFHWKAVLVGAALGGLLCFGMLMLPEVIGLHMVVDSLAAGVLSGLPQGVAAGISAIGLGSVIGALAGATIGIDRYYVRKWFDVSENLVHDSAKGEEAAIARQHEANRLHQISKTDEFTVQGGDYRQAAPQAPASNPLHSQYRSEDQTRPRVRVETGGSHVERLKSVEEAMRIPAV